MSASIERLAFLRNLIESDHPLIPWRNFEYGTIEGQYRLVPGAIEILSLLNRYPGNGQFVKAIEYFEQRTAKKQLQFRIRHFMNNDLKGWFLRRGYQPGTSGDGTDFVETLLE